MSFFFFCFCFQMRDGGSWSGGLMASASLKSLFQETGLGFMWFWGLWFLFEENNKTNKQKWRRLCWEGKPKCQRQSHGGIPRFGGGSAEAGAWGGWRSESQGWCWKGPLVVVRGVERHGCAVPPPKQHPPTPPHQKTASLSQHDEISGTKSLHRWCHDGVWGGRGGGHPLKVTLGEDLSVWEGCINTLWEGWISRGRLLKFFLLSAAPVHELIHGHCVSVTTRAHLLSVEPPQVVRDEHCLYHH